MTAIVRNGRLELAEPVDLPDGTEVEIQLVGTGIAHGERPDDGPMTPEEIARVAAAMEMVEPFDMTAEEEAALRAERQARREWEKAHFEAYSEKLRRIWE